jgi:hypothetical protein
MSNVAFFRRYISDSKEVNIIGVTGTLGSDKDMQFMKKYYSVEFFKIPTFNYKLFYELNGLVLDNEDAWIEAITTVT